MTPTPTHSRKFPLDPAWIALAVAAVVLLLTLSWLVGAERPRPAPATPLPQTATAPVPAAPSPMELLAERLEAAGARIIATEAALADLSGRPPGDPEALATLDRRIAETGAATEQELAARITTVEAALAGRMARDSQARNAAEEALSGRIATTAREVAEQAAATEQALLQRLAAAERALGNRMTSTEQARSAGEQNLTQRMSTLEAALGQRLTGLEDGLTQRLAPLEQALRRLAAAEARTERLTTIEALRSLLDAGRPLGAALPRLGAAPPPPLARFASTSPPTEPALRLAFEEAIRTARTAQAEGVRPRLNALLTIRRGDEVVWGDASEAQIERARRALDAGDLDGALGHLGRLPEGHRQALLGWIGEAESLAAARAALRALSEG